MAKIAYILLCHKSPDAVIAQARELTSAGDFVAIHYDKSRPAQEFARIQAGLADVEGVTLTAKRHRCAWGQWSLVAATLSTLRTAESAFPDATHFYLVSGDCAPIKSATHISEYLDHQNADFIEAHDFFESNWIQTGPREERLIFRHFVNERKHKAIFYAAIRAQRWMGLTRKLPKDIRFMIGSQWWCLRRRSVEAILEFCAKRRDLMRFFRWTWIPDETFFQTLARHLVPDGEIRNQTPTFLMFSDYGMPVNFYDDQFEYLASQDHLFARKISPKAQKLRAELGALFSHGTGAQPTSGEGHRLFRFVTGRGRTGRRFARRIWEADGTLGRDRRLFIVAAQKWHIGKDIAQRVGAGTDIPALGYVFSEEGAGVPTLGGISSSIEKRNRHRRALLSLIYQHKATDRLLICVDPSDFDAIRDFYSDRAQVRLLEIATAMSDNFLIGHAQRLGVLASNSSETAKAAILPTIRNDLNHATGRIRDAGFGHHYTLSEAQDDNANASALAGFLGIGSDAAKDILGQRPVFQD